MNDLISRQAVKEWLAKWEGYIDADIIARMQYRVIDIPSAQPEIIHCRKCKFASGDSRICMKFGHSPIGELDFCAWAERREE